MAEDDERCGYARAELKLRAAAIVVTMPFEVSLDCVACQRRCRTIVFDGIETAGWCMSGMHAFAGRLLELTQHDGVISAVFQYGYHPFVDAKYGDDRYRGFEAGAPTWVRFPPSPTWSDRDRQYAIAALDCSRTLSLQACGGDQ